MNDKRARKPEEVAPHMEQSGGSAGAGDPSDINLAWIMQQSGVARIHYSDEMDSTNNAALHHARSNATDAAELFLAERQTSGRGRGTNRWWSAEGALTFSLLTPALALTDQQLPQVSLASGIAICQAIERLLPAADVSLKWPNDVFLNERKVSGILIEMPAPAPKRFVVGVGINVNNSTRGAPPDVRTRATSMRDSLGDGQQHFFDRSAVLVECLVEIGHKLQMLAAGDPALPRSWQTYSLLTGKWVCVELPQRRIIGVCEGIAEDGALIIGTDQGVEHCYGGVVTDFR